MKLYYASPTQNLKILDPQKQTSTGAHEERKKEIYASNDKSYAAAFCFNWNSSEGFTYEKQGTDPWHLKVPPKYIKRLQKPCSIYTVEDKTFRDLNISTPEWASKDKVKILDEEKYPSAIECLRQNLVKVTIFKRVPFMDNSLIKEFKDLIEKKIDTDKMLVKNFKIDKSGIHGKGVIATKKIAPGEKINVALFKGDKKERYHTTKFGSYINHSYTPNAVTKKEGDKYITYAYDNIESGDEITVDYKVNPELEQPDSSWK